VGLKFIECKLGGAGIKENTDFSDMIRADVL